VALRVAFWTLLWLAAIDVAINLAFPYPRDPSAAPGMLARYFDYGRSIESKLRRMVGTNESRSAAIVHAGWLDPEKWRSQPTRPESGRSRLVAFYGMSFSNQVGEALRALDSSTSIRLIAGPSAPPNFCFAAYRLDRGCHEADAVVLAVLGSSVSKTMTLSGATWNFESPAPYTYPTFAPSASATDLSETTPPWFTEAPFRSAFLEDSNDWHGFRNLLEQHDAYYDRLIFGPDPLDLSALGRMIRRGYATSQIRNVESRVFDPERGFDQDSPAITVLNRLLADFARQGRADGKIPIVLLLHDRMMRNFLFRATEETIRNEKLLVVSTHEFVDSRNPALFVGDGHFIPEVNRQIARQVLDLIEREEGDRADAGPSPASNGPE
jgi:hypothetical protein